MNTGYRVNEAKQELVRELVRRLPLVPNEATEIVDRIAALIDEIVGIQSHPGSPLTN